MESFLSRRELYGGRSGSCATQTRLMQRELEKNLISRLGVTATLQGHEGCVNTLRWNVPGTLLASGSDDRNVIIWDQFGKLKETVKTKHDGNIFGVEFVPYGEDRIVATAAADHMLRVHDIIKQDELYNFRADDRVKRLATAQDEPHLFWSACEDGFIRQHDMRTSSQERVAFDVDGRITKTLAICQGRTELMAVGFNVFYVSVFDRRMFGRNRDHPYLRCAPADLLTRPNPLEHNYTHTTHVAFDYSGNELVVNQNSGLHGGTVFVYDLKSQISPVPTIQKLQSILDGSIVVNKESEDFEEDPRLAEQKQKAKSLIEDSENRDFAGAIRIYTECLFGKYHMSNEQRAVLYANRSFARLLSNRMGDLYCSLRDSIEAILLNPNYVKAYWRLMKGLLRMTQLQLARDVLTVFKERFPISNDLNKLEVELEKEEKKKPIYSDMRDLSIKMIDYESRYTGHKNMHTDIKEANFFGTDNQYIISGSDCGSLIIWDRLSGLVKNAFQADEDILNIAQPHPEKFLIATSGIEHSARLWEPLGEGVEEPRKRELDDMPATSFPHIFMQTLFENLQGQHVFRD